MIPPTHRAAGGASERDLGRQCLATVLQGLAALFSVLLRHRQAVLRSGVPSRRSAGA